MHNGKEEGVDCGGPCEPCPSCTDGVRNQGEEGVDCGGPCSPCASCYDNTLNQGEHYTDCGGPCRPCNLLDFLKHYLFTTILFFLAIAILLAILFWNAAQHSELVQLATYDKHLTFLLNKPFIIRILLFFAKLRGLFFLRSTPHPQAETTIATLSKATLSRNDGMSALRTFFSKLTNLPPAYTNEELFLSLQHSRRPLIVKLLLLILAKRTTRLESKITVAGYAKQEFELARRILRAVKRQL
ncbi:hypothetical protein D6783_00880 [Candidatus Woesearchaeota archaeon]|nr:MAG: hypothetical protein D6783_00880 [Candidatus Woesearchaeota archaeon]